MAPSLVKYNWLFPWNQTANGFQFLKSPTQFPKEPSFSKYVSKFAGPEKTRGLQVWFPRETATAKGEAFVVSP